MLEGGRLAEEDQDWSLEMSLGSECEEVIGINYLGVGGPIEIWPTELDLSYRGSLYPQTGCIVTKDHDHRKLCNII